MDLHHALKTLHASDEYKGRPQQCFLAHAFVMHLGDAQEWQLGYFCEEEDRMLSFAIGETIDMLPPAEVLKSDVGIKELDPKLVKVSPADALATAEKTRKQHYPASLPMRTFYIIQHLENATVYNITFITRDFATVNIRVDATSGTVIKHSSAQLIAFDKQRQGAESQDGAKAKTDDVDDDAGDASEDEVADEPE